jgi:protein TonB
MGCAVKASYLRTSTPAPSAFGVAGMEGLAGPGGVIGSVFGNAATHPLTKAASPSMIAISAGVATGLLIEKVSPVYPPIAKAARVSGTVVLQATISKTGEIENLRVVSGPAMLQSAAIDAVSHWKYRPYLLNGEAVEVNTQINVIFELGGAPPASPDTPASPVP